MTQLTGSAKFSGLAVMPQTEIRPTQNYTTFIDTHVLMDGRETVPSQHKNQGSDNPCIWNIYV